MPATLDTNLLLRLTLRDIPQQYEIVRNLVTQPGARYRVSDMAIAELVHALQHHYDMSRHHVAEIVRAIINDNAIEANTALIDSAINWFENHTSLSYIDCYLADEARATGNEPLVTFDKKLAKQHPSAQLPSTQLSATPTDR